MPFRLANVDGRAALVQGDDYHDLETLTDGALGSDPMAAIADTQALSAWSAKLGDHAPTGRLADVRLGPPVPRPASVFAVGLNYRNHAEESRLAIPDVPMVFTKYPSCIVGPQDDVELRSDHVDYEAELVVALARGGRDIAVEDAWSHVAGLCAGQDISDRSVQLMTTPPQFNLGKSFDTFGPIGPVLVSPDALPDPNALTIRCEVGGELRQEDDTSDLIFTIEHLIAYLSGICTLQAGDLIFTGTPGGVGMPEARFLADGEMIRTEIAGIGVMENRARRGADHAHAHRTAPAVAKAFERRAEREGEQG